MTPNVLFIPASAGLGDVIIENGLVSTSAGGIENRVTPDASSTIANSWTFTRMDFRDATKNGVWTDDGFGLLWNMTDATNRSNWLGYIGSGPGTFHVYETGTTAEIFSLAWNGTSLFTGSIQRYGSTSVDFTGSVAAANTRVDIYHVPD